MKNEIGRKITSLTLMTIMVAGGMTFAIPGVLPAAYASHNANLFVSAENSAYDNYFAGPMVIEVVINDPDLKTLDDVHGEPDVTVNGNNLRVAQNTDGNWYGYLADRSQALLADSISGGSDGTGAKGFGLDFGGFCASTTSNTALTGGIDFTQTVGIAIPRAGGVGGAQNGTGFGTPALTDCTSGSNVGNALGNHVVRENKTLNQAVATAGQIGLNETSAWPIIQLYDFSVGGNVVIQYNKAGGAQSTTLTFDTVDQFAGVELDRTFYPLASQIHVTLTDLQLNIDPTDEDSWTWDGTGGMFYQLFTENGANDAAFTDNTFTTVSTTQSQNIAGNKSSLMFEVNGIVLLTLANDGPTVAAVGDNDDQIFNDALDTGLAGIVGSTAAAANPITFTELGVNTGIFGNYDESDNANLDILSIASDSVNTVRGRSALFEYGEIENSIVVGFGFATIDLVEDSVGGEWNSGEGISVILVDEDANKNTRADEDLDLFDPAVDLIPALRLGSPITLGSATAASFVSQTTQTRGDATFVPAVTQDIGVGTLTNAAQSATANIGGFNTTLGTTIQTISDRYMLTPATLNATGGTQITLNATGALIIDLGLSGQDLRAGINDPRTEATGDRFRGLNQLNFDIQALGTNATEGSLGSFEVLLLVNTSGTGVAGDIISGTGGISGILQTISLTNTTSTRALINLNQTGADTLCDAACTTLSTVATPNTSIYEGIFSSLSDTDRVGLAFVFPNRITLDTSVKPIVFDFFSTGITNDGLLTSERVNNQIVRIELEETGDNTSTFRGWLEYTMLSQINIFDNNTYNTLFPIDDYAEFLVSEDFTDEDSLRVRYNDLGSDGVVTPVADQQEAPTPDIHQL